MNIFDLKSKGRIKYNKNDYWEHALLIWEECGGGTESTELLIDRQEILEENLWWNPRFNMPWKKKIAAAGIHTIQHLLDYRIHSNNKEYKSIWKNIPQEYKDVIAMKGNAQIHEIHNNTGCLVRGKFVELNMISSKDIYEIIQMKKTKKIRIKIKQSFHGFDVKKSNSIITDANSRPQIKEFFFKLRHNKLVTNNQAVHFVDNITKECRICNNETESQVHVNLGVLSL
jgi:S-ribosylhomocysteine lyase LuxS involved in autoinducer biosynthesis